MSNTEKLVNSILGITGNCSILRHEEKSITTTIQQITIFFIEILIRLFFSEKYLYWNSVKIKVLPKFVLNEPFVRLFNILGQVAEKGK